MRIGTGSTVALAATAIMCTAAARADLAQDREAQFKRWTNVGIGGGGAMFYPAGSPHDPNLVFVSSDMGELYRSEDAGKTWRLLDWRNIPHSHSPAFHPTDPKVIYACALAGGVLRVSRDRGLNWECVGGDSPAWKGDELSSIAFDRGNPKLMLLCGKNALYRSTDEGATWAAVKGAPGGLLGVHVDQTSPADKRVCVGAGESGVYRSEDGGLTWAESSQGLPWKGISSFCGGSDAKSGKAFFYCLVPCKEEGGKIGGGVYASADRGATWKSAMGEGILRGRPDQFKFMAMAETHPETVYVTNQGTDDPPPNHYTVFRTDDAGGHWRDVFYNEPRNAGCNTDVGWLTYDRTRGFGDRALGFNVNAGNPDEVFYTNFGEIFITINGGKTWYQAYSRRAESEGKPGKGQRWTSCGIEDTTCWRYVIDPSDKKRHFICYTDIGFSYSDDAGASWHYDWAQVSGIPGGWGNTTYELAVDPDVPGLFWGAFSSMHDIPSWRYCQGGKGGKGGICKSVDHCKTWKSSSQGLPNGPARRTSGCFTPGCTAMACTSRRTAARRGRRRARASSQRRTGRCTS